MVYEGMNSEYYIGMKVPYYRDTMDLEIPKEQEWTEPIPVDSPSGSSSNTATQVSDMADAPEDTADAPETILANLHFIAPQFTAPQRHGSRNLDAPLPIRRRQRKPDKRSKASDMDSDISSRAARKKTPGRRGRPAAAIKAGRVAAAPVAAGDDYTQRVPPSPKQPLPPRELPARHTPKKMWHDEEVWEAPRRTKSVQVVEAGPPSPVKRIKAAAAPRARHPSSPSTKGAQKDGGPCAVCYVTKSATWRRGAAGGRHSGLPLCNKCGVWEFRHPESPARDEMEIEIVSNRRRTSALNGARRAAQRRPSDDSQLDRAFSAAPALPLHQAPTPNPPLAEAPMFRSLSASMQPFSCDWPCAADSMAANGHHFRPNPHQPAATRPNPQPLQRWEGNNLVARVIPALQHVQQVPPSAFAAAAAAASAGAPADAEPLAGQGFAAGKKRSSGDMDDSAVQPAAKRWQIEAYGGGFGTTLGSNASNDGNATRCDGNAGAVVDCFDCGKVKVEGIAQPLRTKITLKVKMSVNPAAAEQQHPAVGLV